MSLDATSDPDPASPTNLAAAIELVVAEHQRGEPLDVGYLLDIAQQLRHSSRVGRCGSWLVGFGIDNNAPAAHCSLPDGHRGWHKDEERGTEWTSECPERGIGDHDCVEHEPS